MSQSFQSGAGVLERCWSPVHMETRRSCSKEIPPRSTQQLGALADSRYSQAEKQDGPSHCLAQAVFVTLQSEEDIARQIYALVRG